MSGARKSYIPPSAANRTDIMASSKTYGPPTVPSTPSKAINDMLSKNCKKTFDNPVKYGVAMYICTVFHAINMVYTTIHKDKERSSHRTWMIACGAISLAIVLKGYLIFKIVMGCTFLLYSLLYYGCLALGLFGVGLGVSGAVFFDKEGYEGGSERRHDFSSMHESVDSRVSSASARVSERVSAYTKND